MTDEFRNMVDHVFPPGSEEAVLKEKIKQLECAVISARCDNYKSLSNYRAQIVGLKAEIEEKNMVIRRLAEWPNGGNSYGQEAMKRFARANLNNKAGDK
jgi:hypothetical protein